LLREDAVGDLAVDYGQLSSSIETIARLSSIETARSDVAMTSLGRAYVRNCIRNNGSWTSGIHLFWWTKKRLDKVPEVKIHDIRYAGGPTLDRLTQLTSWSIMMFRITLIDDIVVHAGSTDEIGQATDLLDKAATEIQVFNTRKLADWLRREVIPLLDARLSYDRYAEVARRLREHNEDRPE